MENLMCDQHLILDVDSFCDKFTVVRALASADRSSFYTETDLLIYGILAFYL